MSRVKKTPNEDDSARPSSNRHCSQCECQIERSDDRASSDRHWNQRWSQIERSEDNASSNRRWKHGTGFGLIFNIEKPLHELCMREREGTAPTPSAPAHSSKSALPLEWAPEEIPFQENFNQF
ncbi:Hypothetical predicted protein [Cloeon dipterum]|uniref:Uncharacterized protein n=1 Tax=Cloeon dipterum TaxID=197152 RepID=A0A8S1DVJ9_9INSE|nr:Hypothetical predicted protein [Cloeon dipterum]